MGLIFAKYTFFAYYLKVIKIKMNLKSLEILTACLVILDQISKYAAVKFFPELVYKNFGSAFSMPIPQNFVILLSFFVILSCVYIFKKHSFGHESFLVLMLSGTVGNLIDRMYLGYVVDFINVGFWPVFNLADVYLSLAVIYLFLSYFKKDEIKF